jgi:hypothetical protein
VKAAVSYQTKYELENTYMLNSISRQESFFGRRPVVATAFLAALLSLCVIPGAAFGQDQEAPPPPPSNQQSEQGMGRHMGEVEAHSRGSAQADGTDPQ